MQYTTKEKDRIDMISAKLYGTPRGAVEQILVDNPGLADYDPVLPADIVICVPDADTDQSMMNSLPQRFMNSIL